MFLNVTYRTQGPYKNLKCVPFFKLMVGLFHELNLNPYNILNTFAIYIVHISPMGKKFQFF